MEGRMIHDREEGNERDVPVASVPGGLSNKPSLKFSERGSGGTEFNQRGSNNRSRVLSRVF
jgi:hypothetical protein